MSSENLHAPRERLSKHALTLHHAIVSLMEELDAIDWYRQRADDTERCPETRPETTDALDDALVELPHGLAPEIVDGGDDRAVALA